MSTEQLLDERQKTHGDFALTAAASQELKQVIAKWDTQGISSYYRECMEMICMKMARALQNPTFKDHWDDIAGYAMLGARESRPSNKSEHVIYSDVPLESKCVSCTNLITPKIREHGCGRYNCAGISRSIICERCHTTYREGERHACVTR